MIESHLELRVSNEASMKLLYKGFLLLTTTTENYNMYNLHQQKDLWYILWYPDSDHQKWHSPAFCIPNRTS